MYQKLHLNYEFKIKHWEIFKQKKEKKNSFVSCTFTKPAGSALCVQPLEGAAFTSGFSVGPNLHLLWEFFSASEQSKPLLNSESLLQDRRVPKC